MQNQWPYPLFTDLMESPLVLNVTAGTTVPPTDFIPELQKTNSHVLGDRLCCVNAYGYFVGNIPLQSALCDVPAFNSV